MSKHTAVDRSSDAQHSIQVIKNAMTSFAQPNTFLSYKVELGYDSTQGLAAWITIKADEDLALSNRRAFKLLVEYIDNIKLSILAQGASHWPYVIVVRGRRKKR